MQTEGQHTDRLLVFAATYNERDNVQGLVSDIWSAAPQAHILIVDDNSPDGTGALLDDIAAGDQRLIVIHRPGKLGLGTAASPCDGVRHAQRVRHAGHRAGSGILHRTLSGISA